MKVALGCDHAGYQVKEKVKIYLIQKLCYNVIDVGTNSNDSVNYPIFGHKVGEKIIEKDAERGIVICGSGIGISIAANKIQNIRAALCVTVEHAKLSRLHNDANVLALGSRLTNEKDIYNIIDVFFSTKFEGGRHLDRIKKIGCYKK